MVKGKNPFQTITLKLSDIQIKQSFNFDNRGYKDFIFVFVLASVDCV